MAQDPVAGTQAKRGTVVVLYLTYGDGYEYV
jgi:beta-lactam-binding protein with PASTA domain